MKIKLLAAILSALCMLGATGDDNLLDNPGFEDWEKGLPVQWASSVWNKGPGVTEIYPDTANPHTGSKCVVIENKQPNDTRLVYEILLQQNQLYEFSCWIKTENVGLAAYGANISTMDDHNILWDIRGTTGVWKRSVIYLLTGTNDIPVRLSLGLGGYGSLNTGKALFDSVKFRKTDSIEEQNAVVIRPGAGVMNISDYKQYIRNFVLKNSGFENWQDNNPDGWYTNIWDTFEGVTEITYDETNPYTGSRALVINNKKPNDARLLQDVIIAGDQLYELSCWVKTGNIGLEHTGASISVNGVTGITWDLRGTNTEWQKMMVYLRTGRNINKITIALALGGFSNINTGMAFFDSVNIAPVEHIANYDSPVINIGDSVLQVSSADIKPHDSLEVALLMSFFVINTGLAVLYSIFRKKNRSILAALFAYTGKPPGTGKTGNAGKITEEKKSEADAGIKKAEEQK